MIRAVLFDVDGTLVDSNDAHAHAWVDAFAEAGVRVSFEDTRRAIGMGVPNVPTWQQDGYTPHVRGIFDDDGRLMVIIHWNTDLGDALEWAEDPYYPLEFSRFASELFLNTIMYTLSY